MTLSIIKLEKLLASKGFVPKTYYTLDGYCIYIEVFSVKNADSFMLYISSRYELIVKDKANIYDMQYMEVMNEDGVVANYAAEPDKVEVEDFYNDLKVDLGVEKTDDMEKKLKEDYDRELTMKDLSKEDRDNIKDIFKQLSRFMYCVKNMKYKLSIFYKNYLCSITKDDELDCFIIKHLDAKKTRKLYIYLDLKTLYTKIDDDISADMKTIKDGVYRLLNQNQMKHSKVLNEMLEQRVAILQYSDLIQTKKNSYTESIIKFEELLCNLNENEKELNEKIYSVRKKTSDYGMKGLHDDIERSHIVSQYEDDLHKIFKIKKEIMDVLLPTREKYDNVTLVMDKILFNNSVMIHEISKNFEKLTEII
jgi:hypothetical protein